jgi:putative spermidine/putrescine transport system permease protein
MTGTKTADRVLNMTGTTVCILVSLFMLIPAITVLVLSFAGGTQLVFPPTSWSFQQYHTVFTNGVWLPAIWQSLKVGIPVTLIALVVGVPAAISIQRSRIWKVGVLRSLGLAPLLVPAVAYAVALYGAESELKLIGTYWGVVFADTMLVIPFVIIVVEAALTRIPRDLELVAMTLGASRSRAMIGITVRLLVPAIVSAFLLCFISNFDESVFINFLSGPGLITLPKAVFNSLRTGLDPSITAVAAMLMLLSTLLVAVAFTLRNTKTVS